MGVVMKKISYVLIVLGIINFIIGFSILYYLSVLNFGKLIGDDNIDSTVMEEFVDPGIKILKYKDSVSVIEEGNVDYSKLGTYEITYRLIYEGKEVEAYTRKVNVVDNKGPDINLNENIIINLGAKLTDDYIISVIGFSIKDNYDNVEDIVYDIDYSLVNANVEGVYTISINAKDKSLNISTKSVKVKVEKVNVESIKLNKDSLSLNVDSSYKLVATVLPNDAYDKSVEWMSEDSSIAKVDSSGKVTALKAGNTKICVTSKANQSAKKCIGVTIIYSAKQKLINKLISDGYSKKSNNVYSKNKDGLIYTFDLNNKSLCSNDDRGVECYYYKKNVGTLKYVDSSYSRYVTYNFNSLSYSCYTDPSYYNSLCTSSNLTKTTVNLLTTLRNLFNTIIKTVGVSSSDL